MSSRVSADLLIKKGIITEGQINKAKEEAMKTGMTTEKALEKLGFISEVDIAVVYADSLGIPFIDLSDYLIDPEVIKLVPEAVANKYKAVPLFKIGNSLTVAMADPEDIAALDEIRIKSKFDIVEPVLSTPDMIQGVIDQYYGAIGSAEELVKGMTKEKMDASAKSVKGLAGAAEEAPVIKLVNLIILQAVKDKASDVHIEPADDKVLSVLTGSCMKSSRSLNTCRAHLPRA